MVLFLYFSYTIIFMAYEITIMPRAKEGLEKFDKELQRRFFNKIEKLKEYPDIYGKPLRSPLVGKWELRFEKKMENYIRNQ